MIEKSDVRSIIGELENMGDSDLKRLQKEVNEIIIRRAEKATLNAIRGLRGIIR